MDAAVIVATALDVPRTGTTKFGLSDVKEVIDEVENGGQVDAPHSRSVGQQPPPKLDAQERKPGEHEKVVGEVEEGAVEVIGIASVKDDEDVMEVEGVENGVDEPLVEDCKAVVVETRERVTVGVTTTVAVDMRTPSISYIS